MLTNPIRTAVKVVAREAWLCGSHRPAVLAGKAGRQQLGHGMRGSGLRGMAQSARVGAGGSKGFQKAAAVALTALGVSGAVWISTKLLSRDPIHLETAHGSTSNSGPIDGRFGTADDYLLAISELETLFKGMGREDDVSIDPGDLAEHGFSAWSYHDEHNPSVVVWVLSTEDVVEVVKIATKYKIPITPYSGGTSLEGHFSATYGGISIDMSRMDKILKIHEADGDAIVQPGCKWEDINEHLKGLGIPLFFPLDPGPGATIGGMIACGCSGTNAVRYGTAKGEWFLNVTVVTPNGQVLKTRSRARKSSAGWDATKLFIGAEGTLGIVTEATIRLAPKQKTKVAVVNFPDVESAVTAVSLIVNAGYTVQCAEFLDSLMMHAINNAGISKRRYIERDSLFFKFAGSDSAMEEVAREVRKITDQCGGADFEFAQTDEEAESLWEGRKTALWSALALKDDYKCWTTDVCVPLSALPRLVRDTKADTTARGLTACAIGHVGDGNVHMFILFKTDEELEATKAAVHKMVKEAQRLGGTATGEHGVGCGKQEYLTAELGENTVELMENVKKMMDPLGIFNPGKLYPNLS